MGPKSLRNQRHTDASASGIASEFGIEVCEEVLVADPRAALTPAQMVEQKLVSLLEGRPVPVSQVRLARVPREDGGRKPKLLPY
jgi:hypothetical protein